MGFGPPARNTKKIAPEIGAEIGPARKIGEKWGRIRIPGFELFFLYFLGGANFGTNLGSYFFPFSGRRPETHFLPRRQVLKACLSLLSLIVCLFLFLFCLAFKLGSQF